MKNPALTAAANTARALMVGAAALAAYSLLHVIATGIVVDETVVPAQIITGDVRYPAWHPHGIFYRSAYSLSHYTAAALYRVWPDSMVLSFARNWVFLFLSLFSVYALTMALTRRMVWAWLATAIVLLEANNRFSGVYPLFVFPEYYSNGHLGLTSGVLAVALWLCGAKRTSAFLIGLLPAIHAMLAAPVWVWAAIHVAWETRKEDLRDLRRVLLPAAAGLAVTVGLAIIVQVWFQTADSAPPFQAEGDGAVIREQFRLMTDVHRRPHTFVHWGYLANAVAFLVLGVVAAYLGWFGPSANRSRTDGRGLRGVLLFGSIIWAYVIGTQLVQHLAGWLPGLVLLSMPNRFSNYSAILVVPLTTVVLIEALGRAEPAERRSLAVLLGLVALASAAFSLDLIAGIDSVVIANNLLLLIWGILFGALVLRGEKGIRLLAIGAALSLGAAFAAFWPFTGAVLYFAGAWLLGLLWCWLGSRRWGKLERTWAVAYARIPQALALAVALAAMHTITGRTVDRAHPGLTRWDMLSDDDRAIDAWLTRNANPDELVLVPLMPRIELQAKTAQPVLFELETLYLMTYMPRLAQVIGTMTKDVYGVDYANPGQLATLCGGEAVPIGCAVWMKTWRRRPRGEWQVLSSKYAFRLVLAPRNTPLDLEPVLMRDRWTLYRIP